MLRFASESLIAHNAGANLLAINMFEVARSEKVTALRNISTLDALFEEANRLNLRPGWIDGEKPIFWPEPKSNFVPAQWHYEEIKALMDSAGRVVDVSLAERRNFALRNPADDNFRTVRTLNGAYQMILPGELAASHRHSSHALRFILDGKGTFSVVNGEKMPMETGDVVLTPGWYWHGHGHEGDKPAYWVDVLDVPLTQLFESMFFEEYPNRYETIVSVATASPFRFSNESIIKGLDNASSDPDGFHGPRIHLPTPDLPMMGLSMERLDAGSKTRRQRSTANHIFVVAEGRGETTVGAEVFIWQPGDIFAVPTWNKYEHKAIRDSVLFVVSDEPLMRSSKYYRFEAD